MEKQIKKENQGDKCITQFHLKNDNYNGVCVSVCLVTILYLVPSLTVQQNYKLFITHLYVL